VSVELFAYTTDPTPVPIALLSDGCRHVGYEVRVLREFTDWCAFRQITEGVVESGDVVCGWAMKDRTARNLSAELERQAAKELADHVASGRIGLFKVEIWSDPAAYNEDLDFDAEDYGAEYAAARRTSTARWYVRLASGRGILSVELAEVVLGCILDRRGGMFEDPQDGLFRVVPRQT
jgi:hypothetical protein